MGGDCETEHLLREEIVAHRRRSIGILDAFYRMAFTLSPKRRDGFFGQSPYTAEPADPKCPDCLLDPAAKEAVGDMKPVPGIEEVMPWGVFAAYAAALASTGFLFVMTLTGGIYLG